MFVSGFWFHVLTLLPLSGCLGHMEVSWKESSSTCEEDGTPWQNGIAIAVYLHALLFYLSVYLSTCLFIYLFKYVQI